MLSALGSLFVPPGITQTFVINGLPFQPARILLRSATPTSSIPTDISLATFSTDKPNSADFPQQSYYNDYDRTGQTRHNAGINFVTYTYNRGAPATYIQAKISAVAPDGFSIQVTANILTEPAVIQWVATGEPPSEEQLLAGPVPILEAIL